MPRIAQMAAAGTITLALLFPGAQLCAQLPGIRDVRQGPPRESRVPVVAPLLMTGGPERPGHHGTPAGDPMAPADPRPPNVGAASSQRGDTHLKWGSPGADVDGMPRSVDLVSPECDDSLVVRRGTGMGSGHAKRSREVAEVGGIGFLVTGPLGFISLGPHGMIFGLVGGWLLGNDLLPEASACGDPVLDRDLTAAGA